MTKTGRKPYETTDIMPFGADSRRLQPPDCLGELQKRAFVDLVCSVPRSQFRASDLPLLCRYAEIVVTADGQVSPWFRIHRDLTRELRTLGQRLQLDPRARAKKAPKTLPASASFYERMNLEGSWDDPS